VDHPAWIVRKEETGMKGKCTICNADTRVIQHTLFGEYHCCADCGFIAKDERCYLSTTAEVELYMKHNNSIADQGYVEYLCAFLSQAVFPFTSDGRAGLDYGSGPGPVLAHILAKNHGYRMDIYDIYFSPERVYDGKKYDLITSTEVVEHLQNPVEHFQLFVQLMKPQSILAVMTLLHPEDDGKFLDWHYIRDPTHISFYTLKTMEYIGEQVGLKIIYTNDVRYVTFSLR
jgi:hypothetical protein